MAEILVRAFNTNHVDPAKEFRGCWRLGMPVVVMPDGHPWSWCEKLPLHACIKFPLISVARVEKYVSNYIGTDEHARRVRRRLWQIRWADLPLAARQKLQSSGELIIKATDSYTGPFDYTWAQVKQYWRNLETGLDETEDI